MEKDPFIAYLYQQISDSSDQKRVLDILKVLFFEKIDIQALQCYCFQGLPEECNGLRPLCWKILLGYLSTSFHTWKSCLDSSRRIYENYLHDHFLPRLNAMNPIKKKEMNQTLNSERLPSDTTGPLYEENKKSDKSNENINMKSKNLLCGKVHSCPIEPDNDDHPLSTQIDSKWYTHFKDQKLWEDITKDTKRTRPNTDFFLKNTDYPLQTIYSRESLFEVSEKETHTDVLSRILFIYAKVNPGIGYMQGMNEVLAPIYYCFYNDLSPMFIGRAEADAFCCFSKLMRDIQDGFVKKLNNSDGGMQASVKILNGILKKVDKQLWTHLEKHHVNPQFYSLKWLMLLLAQEFAIDDVLKVWDRLFSHPKMIDYLNYLCIAMIEGVRDKLIKSSDFASMMETLQRNVNNDLEKIFATGFRLYKQYGEVDERTQHLILPP